MVKELSEYVTMSDSEIEEVLSDYEDERTAKNESRAAGQLYKLEQVQSDHKTFMPRDDVDDFFTVAHHSEDEDNHEIPETNERVNTDSTPLRDSDDVIDSNGKNSPPTRANSKPVPTALLSKENRDREDQLSTVSSSPREIVRDETKSPTISKLSLTGLPASERRAKLVTAGSKISDAKNFKKPDLRRTSSNEKEPKQNPQLLLKKSSSTKSALTITKPRTPLLGLPAAIKLNSTFTIKERPHDDEDLPVPNIPVSKAPRKPGLPREVFGERKNSTKRRPFKLPEPEPEPAPVPKPDPRERWKTVKIPVPRTRASRSLSRAPLEALKMRNALAVLERTLVPRSPTRLSPRMRRTVHPKRSDSLFEYDSLINVDNLEAVVQSLVGPPRRYNGSRNQVPGSRNLSQDATHPKRPLVQQNTNLLTFSLEDPLNKTRTLAKHPVELSDAHQTVGVERKENLDSSPVHPSRSKRGFAGQQLRMRADVLLRLSKLGEFNPESLQPVMLDLFDELSGKQSEHGLKAAEISNMLCAIYNEVVQV